MAEIEGIRQANAAALAAVHRAHLEEMTAKAAQLLRTRGISEAVVGAEDVVQTAFENALCAPEQLREPRAYVYAALRREVGHWAKRLCREREREAQRLTEERTASGSDGDAGAVVTDRLMVRDAVSRLPEQQRAPVVAAKMYGFTQKETAQLTRRHPGTVAVHIARAVGTLALYLTPGVAIVVFVVLMPAAVPHFAIFLLSDLAYLWAIQDRMARSDTIQKITAVVRPGVKRPAGEPPDYDVAVNVLPAGAGAVCVVRDKATGEETVFRSSRDGTPVVERRGSTHA